MGTEERMGLAEREREREKVQRLGLVTTDPLITLLHK